MVRLARMACALAIVAGGLVRGVEKADAGPEGHGAAVEFAPDWALAEDKSLLSWDDAVTLEQPPTLTSILLMASSRRSFFHRR